MRGLNLRLDSVSQEADEKYYLKRMKEIIEEFPNKGPPFYPTRLSPVLYIGSQRNADDITTLQRIGITHVLNCAGTRRFDFSRSPYGPDSGIKDYLMIPAEDHDEFNIMSYFKDAISFINKAKYSNGKILVHCNLGVNRSGAICAAYLMMDLQMTLLEVITFLKTKRSVVLYNKSFRRQLYRYARNKGLLDPVITTTDELALPSASRGSKYLEKAHSTSQLEQVRSKTPKLQVGGSLDSATMRTSFLSSSRKKFGTKLFKRYGRSLSNSVVEEEIAHHKDRPSSSSSLLGSDRALMRGKEEDPRESRFARSFLTLPRRSTSTLHNNNNNKVTMDPLPENLPVQNFSGKSSAVHKRRAYKEKGSGSSLDKNDELLQTYQETGFSTTLLPGTKRKTDRKVSNEEVSPVGSDAPASPKMSTMRPLRVYRRSATDSEVYCAKRGASGHSGAQGAEAPRTPRSPGSENNLDKLSRDFTAFSFEPLPTKSSHADGMKSPSHVDARSKPLSRWISAE